MLNQQQIKENHSSTWKNIWLIYNTNQKFYRGIMFIFSSGLSLAAVFSASILNIDFFTIICKITDLYISIIPNLLGFNLGAYALLIGLASSTFLPSLTKGINKGFTFFQKASSVFAFCITVQAITLIMSFIIRQIVIIQELSMYSMDNKNVIACYLNISIFFILNFLGIYSILLILMLVKNIFGLSQTANFFSGMENLKPTEQITEKKDFNLFKEILKKIFNI